MSFTLDLQKFAQRATIQADKAVRKIVLDVGTKLVEKSPVGDAKLWASPPPPGYVGGRFRANWQYGFGAADITTSEKIDPEGETTVALMAAKVLEKPATGIHYITNSLPYAQRLEDGWSTQAPLGMVGLTVIEFETTVKDALIELDARAAAATL